MVNTVLQYCQCPVTVSYLLDSEDRQLHVYSAEGSHVTSINLLDGDTLKTLCGHLAVTLCILLIK
jgi:hypothetical protein